MLLWPFNKYPGTDYETFNWEWILKTVKDWVATMTEFVRDMTDAWNVMRQQWVDYQDDLNDDWRNYQDDWRNYQDDWRNYQDDLNDQWQEFIDDTYKDQITEILEDHPEWVTTVMDGTITKPKINSTFLQEIENAYATPEMYGAIGDGIVDDTTAFQQALDDNRYVVAKNTYKVTSIELENVKLDLRGEIIGQCVIHHNSTIEGGKITQTSDDPCIIVCNTSGGESHLTSFITGVDLHPTLTGIGLKFEAINDPMAFYYVDDVNISSCDKSIVFETGTSWITKGVLTNIICNTPTTCAVYMYNNSGRKEYMGDIIFRDVTAQYYQNKPENFVKLDKGNCYVTLYDSFCYDGIGDVKFWVNDNANDTKFTLLGNSGNENDPALTNKTNLRWFFFSASASISSVDYRKASQAVLPPVDFNGGGYFESFSSPSINGRFEGILMRGGATEATGATNHIFGISFHRGILSILRNTTPDISTAKVFEVTTPYSGAVYTTATLPYGTDVKSGATCWCSDIKMPLTNYQGVWYKPDGTAL